MDVFRFVILEQVWIRSDPLADLLEPIERGAQLRRRKHAGLCQCASMSGTGLQLALEQAAIEFPRALPALECRVKRLPEAARPHLHRATSAGFRSLLGVLCVSFATFAVTFLSWFFSARDREGKPRIRMN